MKNDITRIEFANVKVTQYCHIGLPMFTINTI